jgi:hypothetical protein
MRKSLIAAAIAGTFALPSVAMAQAAAAPASPHTFSPNIGVVSDYLFRGVSQTRGGAALQGGVDYSHSSGLYAGIWASTITWVKDAYGSGSTEIDYYGGYKNSFGGSDFTYDIGAIAYTYPGKGNAIPGTNVNHRGTTGHETRNCHHQALQARRSARSTVRHWRAGNHRDRSQGVRSPEGAHRAVPWCRIRGRFSAQGEDRSRVKTEILDQVIEAIEKSASTGKIGDGKIFVFDLEQAIRIRTGESGEEAL